MRAASNAQADVKKAPDATRLCKLRVRQRGPWTTAACKLSAEPPPHRHMLEPPSRQPYFALAYCSPSPTTHLATRKPRRHFKVVFGAQQDNHRQSWLDAMRFVPRARWRSARILRNRALQIGPYAARSGADLNRDGGFDRPHRVVRCVRWRCGPHGCMSWRSGRAGGGSGSRPIAAGDTLGRNEALPNGGD